MVVSVVTCPHCGVAFNYRYVPMVSFTAFRLGRSRSFRCPQCRQRGTFDLTSFGTNPNLPTYRDPLARALVVLGLLLGGGLVTIVVATLTLSGSSNELPAILTASAVMVLGLVALAVVTFARSRLVLEAPSARA